MHFKDLIGVPFKKHGRDKQGMDCYGLAMEVYRRRGIEMPEFAYSTIERTFVHGLITGNMDSVVDPILKPEPYCLLSIMIRPPYLHHIGVVLENTEYFIHVMEKRNVVIERVELWRHRIKGFYRWKSSSR